MRALLIRQVDNGYAVWDGEGNSTVQMRVNGDPCVPRWVFVSPTDLASFVSKHMSGSDLAAEYAAKGADYRDVLAKRGEASA